MQQEANLSKVMTKIGAICLITIGLWMVIELAVQFGHYGHACYGGAGEYSSLLWVWVLWDGWPDGTPLSWRCSLGATGMPATAPCVGEEGCVLGLVS